MISCVTVCPILGRDGDSIGNVLSPHNVSLLETVKLWKKEGNSLLLLCIAVLLVVTKAIVNVTEKN
jgi:hypothetical protein